MLGAVGGLVKRMAEPAAEPAAAEGARAPPPPPAAQAAAARALEASGFAIVGDAFFASLSPALQQYAAALRAADGLGAPRCRPAGRQRWAVSAVYSP